MHFFSMKSSSALNFIIIASLCLFDRVHSSDVVDLTTSTFEEFINSKELALVEFFAPWCGHCKALKPEYESAATTLKSFNISLAKVDCTVEEEVCNQVSVAGYPTLKVYRSGKSSEYGGERKADSIVSYMKKQALPAVSEVNSETLSTFSKQDRVVVIAFTKANSEEESKFHAVAESLRNDFVFGHSKDAKLAKSEGSAFPGIIIYRSFDEPKVVFKGKFDEADIESFVSENSVPLIDEIGAQNYAKYMDLKLPIVFIFYSSKEESESLVSTLSPVAKNLKGKASFVTIDFNKFGSYAKVLNLKEETTPLVAIHDVVEDGKYPFQGEVTPDAVEKHVRSVLEGTIKPVLKSQPVPENNDGDVVVVVGSEYEKIVLDETKNVFIEFYAPWCGHCKNLAPIWEELGKEFKTSHPNVVIAKMDATENDLPIGTPFKIQGFPTLKFYPASDKLSPLDYEGDRSLDELVAFVKSHVDGSDVDATKDEEQEVEKDEL